MFQFNEEIAKIKISKYVYVEIRDFTLHLQYIYRNIELKNLIRLEKFIKITKF